MVKPLSFKGDKKPKKRKHAKLEDDEDQSAALTSTSQTPANDAAAEDDSWVSAEAATDLAGPTIVALPTTPATCLACDANGSVFSSPIENIAEGDSATAEPHDVRQVWVANRVAGTEWISFKGHHGKFVSTQPLRSHSISAIDLQQRRKADLMRTEADVTCTDIWALISLAF